MTSACGILKRQVEGWRTLGHMMLVDEFVLRNGKPYIAAPYRGERGEAKMCFRNAFRMLIDKPNLVYVEGYALRPDIGLLVHHAWLADPNTQRVVDPTWKDPQTCDYFGVPFTTKETMQRTFANGVYGILAPNEMASTDLMFARDPELQKLFEAKHPAWQANAKPQPAKPSRKSGPSSKASKRMSKSRSSAKLSSSSKWKS